MEYNGEGESLVTLARAATALGIIPLSYQVSIYDKEEAAVLQSLRLHNLGLSVKLISKLLSCTYMYILKFSH